MFFIYRKYIKDTLSVKNGVYIPSIDFGDFMCAVREGDSSGYGLIENKFKFFLKL